MPEMLTLQDVLVDELRDLYDAERQLVKALPTMANRASNDDLRTAIEAHLQETENHVTRLEQAFKLVGEPPKAKHCAGIAGIIEEGSEAIALDADDAVTDAVIIASAQRAEHYEIAAYGTSVAWAEALELRDLAHLLRLNLNEEKAADNLLTSLAERGINNSAIDQAEDENIGEGASQPKMSAERELSGSSRGGASSRSRKR
jgi:ferritin-like metal-binding protein YciE